MFFPVSSSVTFRAVCRLNIKDRTIVYNGFLWTVEILIHSCCFCFSQIKNEVWGCIVWCCTACWYSECVLWQGNLIAIGTFKGYTQIWDVAANKKVNNLHGHTARVGELLVVSILFPFSGRWEGHLVCKKVGVGLLVVTIDWNIGRLIAPVVTTTAVILSSNKIQNGDILVLANPGPPGNGR